MMSFVVIEPVENPVNKNLSKTVISTRSMTE